MGICILNKEVMINRKLATADKTIYTNLTSYMDQEGTVEIDLDQLAIEANTTRRNISTALKRLETEGFIAIQEIDIIAKLKNKQLEGKGIGTKKCEWCKIKTTVLEAHHYPIPKAEGGKETIDICPNCHREYHYYQKPIKVNLPKEIIDKFNKERRGDND